MVIIGFLRIYHRTRKQTTIIFLSFFYFYPNAVGPCVISVQRIKCFLSPTSPSLLLSLYLSFSGAFRFCLFIIPAPFCATQPTATTSRIRGHAPSARRQQCLGNVRVSLRERHADVGTRDTCRRRSFFKTNFRLQLNTSSHHDWRFLLVTLSPGLCRREFINRKNPKK